MNLERNQRIHDAHISNNHNMSGSNDPHQLSIDVLIRGAEVIANGRSQGYTDEQIISHVLGKIQG